MVYRLYVERKPGFDHEAHGTLKELQSFLRIESLTGLRILNRYDVEGLAEELFQRSIPTVFSEPQSDHVLTSLPEDGDFVLAAEYLPGQFDQRADSASQCIQLAYGCERPLIRTATVYIFSGALSDAQKAAIERTAQAILHVRALYPDCSLADLYDEVTMPVELRRAHQANDKAVMQAYGFWGKLNTETACVAELMKMYQKLTEQE